MSEKKDSSSKDFLASRFPEATPDMIAELKRKRILLVAKIAQALRLTAQMKEKTGFYGTTECPSCLQTTSNTQFVRDRRSPVSICQRCFVQWTELYLAGHVKRLTDIIPRVMC